MTRTIAAAAASILLMMGMFYSRGVRPCQGGLRVFRQAAIIEEIKQLTSDEQGLGQRNHMPAAFLVIE
jgi:hypothetical protein